MGISTTWSSRNSNRADRVAQEYPSARGGRRVNRTRVPEATAP